MLANTNPFEARKKNRLAAPGISQGHTNSA